MTTKTIECIDCGESVPYGRLSCPACGTLLASVAGALRAPIRVIEADESPEPEALEEPKLAEAPEAEEGPAAEPTPDADVEPEPSDATVAEVEPVVQAEPEPEAEVVAEPEAEPGDIAAAVATPPALAPDLAPWPPLESVEPVLEPRAYVGQRTDIPDGVATSPAAYRPPTFALAAATAAGPSWAVGAAALGGSGRSADPASIAQPKDDAAGETSIADRTVELAGWLVIAGATMSVLGFLLPWSRVVIGSANLGGYFDMWGLASPSHVIVVVGLLAVLGLGVVPNRVPTWIRTGVLGLSAGGILVGLAWPYVVGPLGADIGLILALVGGIALGVGGILATWATRHAPGESSV